VVVGFGVNLVIGGQALKCRVISYSVVFKKPIKYLHIVVEVAFAFVNVEHLEING
jgi:hypothetical protein